MTKQMANMKVKGATKSDVSRKSKSSLNNLKLFDHKKHLGQSSKKFR